VQGTAPVPCPSGSADPTNQQDSQRRRVCEAAAALTARAACRCVGVATSPLGLGRRRRQPRDQVAALLPVFERVLGADHLGALNARANLAY
jgi:hypothetical protein